MPLLGRRIYLNAVDLNDGRQKIFAHCGVVNLDAAGCGKLWRQYREDSDHEVPIAQAVGASSAIPPIFRPVAVRDGNALVGVFVDGGVADNLALNLAKAFSVHIHRGSGSSYQDDGQGYASFQKFISFILVLDGSMPLGEKRKTSWTRLFSIKRVSEAMMNQQVSEAAIATFGFERTMNIPCAIASLQFGMPGNVGADVPDVGHLFKRVRTHLDSFSRQECAVLAYCGYATIDLMLRERPSMLAKYRGARDAPLRAFGDILPERCGAWDPAPESADHALCPSPAFAVAMARTNRRDLGQGRAPPIVGRADSAEGEPVDARTAHVGARIAPVRRLPYVKRP
jgi:hypothetical protein